MRPARTTVGQIAQAKLPSWEYHLQVGRMEQSGRLLAAFCAADVPSSASSRLQASRTPHREPDQLPQRVVWQGAENLSARCQSGLEPISTAISLDMGKGLGRNSTCPTFVTWPISDAPSSQKAAGQDLGMGCGRRYMSRIQIP